MIEYYCKKCKKYYYYPDTLDNLPLGITTSRCPICQSIGKKILEVE
jgi:hypothetical protein